MYPHERSLVKNLAGKKFALIGINSDPDPADPQRLVEEGTVTWRSFWNGKTGPGGPIAKAYGVSGWPHVILIDAKGIVRYVNPQRKREEGMDFNTLISKLMEENGEEFPLQQIEKDTEAEEAKGSGGGDGIRRMGAGNMSTDQMRKESERRNKNRGNNPYGKPPEDDKGN